MTSTIPTTSSPFNKTLNTSLYSTGGLLRNLTNVSDAPVCGHIFTTYIVPDILHCASFLIGLVYFRITEGEPMYSLMEKV